jgi:hypothetical protein
MVPQKHLVAFMIESLRIEGIMREPSETELFATERFLATERPTVSDVCALVHVYQPDARLRDRPGLNVRVGNHIAPPGGPEIVGALGHLLLRAPQGDPWQIHVDYEKLHPFTDGNGRSGRALWAWQMVRRQNGLPLGFLHQWYYQTLERAGT